jgi:hypothetical protein
MIQSARGHTRRITRLATGSLLVLWTGVTAALFLGTGRPLPRSFQSWESLGCVPKWLHDSYRPGDTIPRFFLFSECGKYYATEIPEKPDSFGRRVDIQIHDIFTKSVVCLLRQVENLPQAIQILPDSKNVVVATQSTDVYEWPSGKWLRRFPQDEQHEPALEFDRSGRRFIRPDGQAAKTLTLAVPTWPGNLNFPLVVGVDRTLDVYFDSTDRPKALVLTSGFVARWDIKTQRPDWESSSSDYEATKSARAAHEPDPDQEATAFPHENIFVAYHHKYGICVRSLEDGSVLGIHKLSGDAKPVKYSDDGRHVLGLSRRERGWFTALRQISPQFQKWAEESEFCTGRYAITADASVLDIQSGKNYPGLTIADFATLAAFQEETQTLLTAADDGLYEWDLPPRWRWFTPWAWPALAGWIMVAFAWWRLGKTRNVPSGQNPQVVAS